MKNARSLTPCTCALNFFDIHLLIFVHSSYTAKPFTVRRYFWRGWRGESGCFIFTRPSEIAGEREYSRKLGRPFKPTASIISFTLFSLIPIARINRFTLSDKPSAILPLLVLVLVLVQVLVWALSSSVYPISIFLFDLLQE